MKVGKNKIREIEVSMTNSELLIEKDQITVAAILLYKGQDKK